MHCEGSVVEEGCGGVVELSDLGDSNVALESGLKVDMVGADAAGDTHLQVGGHLHTFPGDVCWPANYCHRQLQKITESPERLGHDNVGVGEVLLQLTSRAIFVRGHDKGVATVLEELLGMQSNQLLASDSTSPCEARAHQTHSLAGHQD